MPARKRPAPAGTAIARRVLVDGLAAGTGIFELPGELDPLHSRNDTLPARSSCT